MRIIPKLQNQSTRVIGISQSRRNKGNRLLKRDNNDFLH